MSYFGVIKGLDPSGVAQQVDISVPTPNSHSLNTLTAGVVEDFYPKNLADHTEGDIIPLAVDTAGNLKCRSAVTTDEGSVYEPFAGAALSADWTAVTGTGQTVTVANSLCSIAAGTTANAEAYITRSVDYAPLTMIATFTISQRIANQTIYFGFADGDVPANDTMYARFKFTGTDNTQVIIESASSLDTGGSQTATVKLPYGLTSASSLIYKIEARGKQIDYWAGTNLDQLVRLATLPIQMPDPYTVMNMRVRVTNGASSPASSTTISVDTIDIANINILDADVRVYSGNIAITQNVLPSGGNNTTANINAGNTWTGASETTLGVAGIQFMLKTDQNVIVYIDQSLDGTNWDIADSFVYKYSLGGTSRTVQAVGAYFRARIYNNSVSNTTYMRFGCAMCPIVEALPRATDSEGNLRVCIQDFEDVGLGFKVLISPMGELRVSEHVKLVGEKFEGTTVDANFWASTVVGTGSVAQANSEATLSTGATANSSILLNSVRSARYVGSYPNYYRGVIECPAITGACTRRWGAFDATDGFFFSYDGTTLSVVTRKGGADTTVASGSFNGAEGSTFAIDVNSHTYEIDWTNSSVWFMVDNKFIHKYSGNTDPAANNQSLKVGAQILNTGGNTNNNTLKIRTHTINRVGPLESEKIYKNLTGAATTVLKYGAGRLKRINNNAGLGTAVVYDNTAGSGTTIATITFSNNLNYDFDCPFFTGLTIVTTGTSQNSTIIYE